MRKTVYVLGNPLINIDCFPIKLLPKLRILCPQINFEVIDPTEELTFNNQKDLLLIDTVVGIKKVTIFHDLKYFTLSPRVTVHDYDLLLNLSLLKKFGKIKNILIIGIPVKGNQEVILKKIINALYLHLNFKK